MRVEVGGEVWAWARWEGGIPWWRGMGFAAPSQPSASENPLGMFATRSPTPLRTLRPAHHQTPLPPSGSLSITTNPIPQKVCKKLRLRPGSSHAPPSTQCKSSLTYILPQRRSSSQRSASNLLLRSCVLARGRVQASSGAEGRI